MLFRKLHFPADCIVAFAGKFGHLAYLSEHSEIFHKQPHNARVDRRRDGRSTLSDLVSVNEHLLYALMCSCLSVAVGCTASGIFPTHKCQATRLTVEHSTHRVTANLIARRRYLTISTLHRATLCSQRSRISLVHYGRVIERKCSSTRPSVLYAFARYKPRNIERVQRKHSNNLPSIENSRHHAT